MRPLAHLEENNLVHGMLGYHYKGIINIPFDGIRN